MKFSIGTKTVILIVVIALMLSGTAILVSQIIIRGIVDDDYKQEADSLSATVAVTIDADQVRTLKENVFSIYNNTPDKVTSEKWGTPEFEAYLANFREIEQTEEFKNLREFMARIQDQNECNCIYLIARDYETGAFVYLCDADPAEPCAPGLIDHFTEIDMSAADDPKNRIHAYISNTDEYGWLVTAGTPVFDRDGNPICYACCDLSMEEIRKNQVTNVLQTVVALLAVTVLLCVGGILLARLFLIEPINTLSDAAAEYFNDESDPPHDTFEKLDIRSHDEIATLAESMKKMERDINDYIAELMVTSEVLSATEEQAQEMQKQAKKMSHIAMVDGMTNVRNKRAFDTMAETIDDDIKKGQAEFGIALIDLNNLKETNDTYGHEKGDEAIREVCHLICTTFKHSPVFRVGGDEFVALVINEDYEHAEALVEKFFKQILKAECNMEKEPWERVSAAIGYSAFEPGTDRHVEEVYQRADAAMYKKKKEMKGRK